MKRYLSRERLLTPEERVEAHQRLIAEAEEEVDRCQSELADAKQALSEAIDSEPRKTTTEYLEVKPGEPGYEDAPLVNSMIMYAGEVIQQNIADRPSPWTSIIERGTYPEGLGKL